MEKNQEHQIEKLCSSIHKWDVALWARIAQNVKKLPLTVNVIDFEFFVLNVPEWVPWSPLDPKCYNTLVELFRFTEYVEKNKMHIAPFLKFQ